ncbi:MAG: hypothetical protein ACUVSL_03800, partial [Chloroflexus sp.]
VPEQLPIIVVALASLPDGDWGPVWWNGRAYEVNGQEVPLDHGLLMVAPASPPRLVVAGATPTALRLAAQALGTSLPAAAVLAVTQPPPQLPAASWRDGAASFAQLGVDLGRWWALVSIRSTLPSSVRPAGMSGLGVHSISTLLLQLA